MAEVLDIGHESDLSEYTSTVTDGGDLSQSGGAALGGTSGGMQALIDDTTEIYGSKTFTTLTSTSYRFRFYIDPNGLTMSNSDEFRACEVSGASTATRAVVNLRYLSGYYIRAGVRDDSLSTQYTSFYSITDDEHYVEALVTYASSDVASDATLDLWIDGVHQEQVTGVDLYDLSKPEEVRLGAIYGIDAGTSGTLYLDELVLRDDSTQIGPVGGAGVPIGAIAMGGYRRRRAA